MRVSASRQTSEKTGIGDKSSNDVAYSFGLLPSYGCSAELISLPIEFSILKAAA